MRFVAAVLVALMLPMPARGTLVVIVPSADGLVVAADSRISVLGTTCDEQFKIAELRRPRRTVIAVTGDGVFIRPPNIGQRDVCGYLKTAERTLDIPLVVRRYLERANANLDKLQLEDLESDCVRAVERFRENYPHALESYAGRELFSVVIASYDPKSKTATVLNFVVKINASTNKAEAGRFMHTIMTPQTRRGVWSYGETDFLNSNVFGGVGRKYLAESTEKFILVDAPVAEVRQGEAVAVAANVIEAASKTTALVQSPSAIGGPIDMVVLGRGRQIEDVR